MFNEKDVLARLQNGESPEDIAKELTKILNGGMALQREQEEKDQAAKKENQKYQDFQSILDEMSLFFMTYYPEFANDDMTLVAKDVLPTVENIMGMCAALDDLMKEVAVNPPVKTETKAKPKNKNTDKIITDFLNHMGWSN